jgi:hypothetical protein
MSLAFAAGATPKEAGDAITEYFEKGTITTALQGKLTSEAFTSNPALASLATGLGVGARIGGVGGVSAGGRRRLTEGGDDEGGDTTITNAADDFVYRGDGVRGTLTPIDERDTFVGMKPGGAIDRAVNGGGGGSVTVNIYGGDERRVYDVVKRVLQQTGIGPTRVASRA